MAHVFERYFLVGVGMALFSQPNWGVGVGGGWYGNVKFVLLFMTVHLAYSMFRYTPEGDILWLAQTTLIPSMPFTDASAHLLPTDSTYTLPGLHG